ncbi:MAG: hypothetical protein A2445_05660 [Candidatus Jacksonbacteria bacterium RIFOXYC2_FULL_44_29]|nr:MAG: hypothetical protein UW45_C0008G0014 [Parcubacteria group bacterium GW2011_GWC2_44_22]OGY76000.1 MAG: hypothetical protein A2240_05505 [Candidatus Jacksonbacteria bacterium RIFOXYA2_FULL_43_12]OGY76766.1 MAG: hypothetical protein A2295_00305 [Candidatus Jacksonbacteria bacterium RIFOXYB2_FULL_44_15]OGY79173.1 MAG: hypothetical protein A2445_05660 [Candidatus Jacksonbacteria bacterium RIFOXYC2_FULL_44_29]OGY82108.1 MAG: hypothetical protein A2550_00220 [Candidatus Jacksonbacteria bacteri
MAGKKKQEIDELTPAGSGQSGQFFGHSEQMDSKREETRSHIALIYVVAYVAIIAGAILLGTWKHFTVDDHRDMLLAISGILSGPLGFIIGYYFKANRE